MTFDWTSRPDHHGAQRQAGMPKSRSAPEVGKNAGGRILRGVVLSTYVYDAPESVLTNPTAGKGINSVYCDVLLYGETDGVLPRCLVLQQRGGLHEGEIWKPRATTLDITDSPIDPDSASSPANLDGDHVAVSFFEGDAHQPVIIGAIPHPSSDIGNDSRDLGQRLRLKEADGNPRFWKHRGGFFGIDTNGNWLCDLRRAHEGEYNTDGSEPDPAGSGASGNHTIKLPPGSSVTVSIDDGATVLIQDKDGNTTMTVGDGAVSVAIADHLQTLYNQLKTQIDAFDVSIQAHVHPATLPVSGTPPVASGTTSPSVNTGTISAPAYDTAINSTKVTIPDG